MSACGVLCEGVARIVAWMADGSFWHLVIFFVLGSSSPDPFSSEYRREGAIGKSDADRGYFSSDYRREGEIGKSDADRGHFSSEYRREGEIGKLIARRLLVGVLDRRRAEKIDCALDSSGLGMGFCFAGSGWFWFRRDNRIMIDSVGDMFRFES